jgi:hypothetical protein
MPAFVSTGSSSRISTKPIDFSFSKWDGLIGSNFCPDVPEGPTEVDSFLNVKVVERVVVVGHFAQGLTECSTNCKPAGTVLFPARCERLAAAIILTESANRENAMSDQHQVNSIIAAAISDARKDHPDGRIDPKEAKQVAKCIIEALSSAGLQILPMSKD